MGMKAGVVVLIWISLFLLLPLSNEASPQPPQFRLAQGNSSPKPPKYMASPLRSPRPPPPGHSVTRRTSYGRTTDCNASINGHCGAKIYNVAQRTCKTYTCNRG